MAIPRPDPRISTWTDFKLTGVPEPSTMVLGAAGLIVAVAARRFKVRR